MTSTTRVYANKLLLPSQLYESCEPTGCELQAQKLRVASLRHCELTSVRVPSQRPNKLQPFSLTICRYKIVF